MFHEGGKTNRLTGREIEVLKLVATGLSTKQIATSLKIAFKTAACHRSRIMSKLGIHEIANLTRFAIRCGYVDVYDAGRPREHQDELFETLRLTQAKYRTAMEQYGAFMKERETLGLTNPDSSTGARRLRQAEEFAHKEYHAALVALKDFLSSVDRSETNAG